MTGPRGARRPKESYADRRARRAAIDDPTVVLDAGLRFLEARARSVAEVRRRLGDAGYRSELVEGAIERLGELGFLDDAAFASAWVASRDRAHPRGARALRSELMRKGIDAATIKTVLDEREAAGSAGSAAESAADPLSEGADLVEGMSVDEAAARRLLTRNARALGRVADPRKRRQRAYALLARHGFDPEICSRVASDEA